jgi:AAA family ATP:ADP antiporter
VLTVLRREDKYKSKSFIDTFGYRLGDQLGNWTYAGLRLFGVALTTISYLAVPLVAIWCLVGLWLGRKQKELAATPHPDSVNARTAVRV